MLIAPPTADWSKHNEWPFAPLPTNTFPSWGTEQSTWTGSDRYFAALMILFVNRIGYPAEVKNYERRPHVDREPESWRREEKQPFATKLHATCSAQRRGSVSPRSMGIEWKRGARAGFTAAAWFGALLTAHLSSSR